MYYKFSCTKNQGVKLLGGRPLGEPTLPFPEETRDFF